jgi:hypothetical protein
MTIYYGSYWSFNGNLSVQIQWILKILTLSKALTIRIHFLYMAIYYDSYWSFNGNLRVQIQWILKILTFNKALKIKILYCIYGQVTSIHIGDSTEIWGDRYSGYWKYWRSRRPTQLEYFIVYTAMLQLFILECQRQIEGTDTVEIENIDVQ